MSPVKMLRATALAVLLTTAGMAVPVAAFAQESAATAQQSVEERKDRDFKEAAAAAQAAAIAGPKDVPLLSQATLRLPEGYMFIPQPQAGKLSLALGNTPSSRMVGIIASQEGGGWLAYLDYADDGHVKDDDAKTWNADELLQNLKDGTEAANAERAERGFPPIEVAGWIEKPSYDAAMHRMVWSALVRDKGATGNAGAANYNTYALGRDGHFELDLVASADKIDSFKGDAATLLAALTFNEGRRYQDFNESTDRVAAYGLAALVGGLAAKKLGLLALAAAFVAKFFKLIAIGALALAGGLKSLFRRKSGGSDTGTA